MPPGELEALRDQIAGLVTAAARADGDRAAALRDAERAHEAEVTELLKTIRCSADRHADEDLCREALESEVSNLRRALESRDVIAQAKGVLMMTMWCTAEQAFAMMVTQSQHENRKLVEIAAEIVQRVERRAVQRAGPTS